MSRHIPDEIYFPAPPATTEEDNNHHHIIFLPGNPGCVAYYESYLAQLYNLLNNHPANSKSMSPSNQAQPKASHPRYTIYARSYPGFTLNPSTSTSALSKRFPPNVSGSYSLQTTISFAEAVLQSYVSKLASRRSPSKSKPKIVLIAHSLGTFITLELLRRRNARLASLPRGQWSADAQFEMTAAVLLFPTVMDLALSSNGLKFSWAVKQRYTATIVAAAAWVLVSVLTGCGLFGEGAVVKTVQLVTGMTEQAAGVTARWLGTSGGVFQAVRLAGDEMREISHDRWSEDVWGAVEGDGGTQTDKDGGEMKTNVGSKVGEGRTRLLFYYGETDHWVANKTRDELIAARGGPTKNQDQDANVEVLEVDAASVGEGVAAMGEDGDARPRMVIGEVGIPHGFCIRHSEPVAKMTADYLKEIIG